MKVLDTEHKRKSAVITILILLLLLFGIFNVGMKYLDPPIEYGLAINFGDADVGKGDPVEEIQKENLEEQQEEFAEEEPIEEEVSEPVSDDVITDEAGEELPVIEEKEPTVKEVKKVVSKEQIEKKKEETIVQPKPKPKPSKATSDALNALLGGTIDKGEGDDNESGVKGNKNGNPNASKYYGNAGSGSGGNYNLAGRKALSKPIQKPDCEEEGTVVVTVFVNNKGNVIKAVPGEKGSTNTAPCLLKAAKEAALLTQWNSDTNAPEKQKGAIIYKFSLSQ